MNDTTAALRETLLATVAALEQLLDGIKFRGLPSRSDLFVARRAAKKGRDAYSALFGDLVPTENEQS